MKLPSQSISELNLPLSATQHSQTNTDFIDIFGFLTEALTNQKHLSHQIKENNFNQFLSILDSCDPNLRDSEGVTATWTPLYWAVKLRRFDFVEQLLEYGADINSHVTDYTECCGTVLDLIMMRQDIEMEALVKRYIVEESINIDTSQYKSIKTKLRGRLTKPFNFKSNYSNQPKM